MTMPRTGRKVSNSGFYHVMLRGNGKQLLFDEDADRHAFLNMLEQCLTNVKVDIIAWCLMDNHVHLCLREGGRVDGSELSAMMSRLETRFAGRFNWKTGHVGHVFQGRFLSMPIEDEPYLLEAVRYIHNNPEKAGICPAAAYWWSSYHEYVGRPRLCDTSVILDALGGIEGFVAFSQAEPERLYRFSCGSRVPDALARDVALDVLSGRDPREVKSMRKDQRDEALQRLRAARLSVRQIQELTAIGAATITRATTR